MFFCSAVPGQVSPDAAAKFCPKPAIGPVIPPAPDRSAAPIIVYARQLDANNHEKAEARGHVELYRADQYLATERLIYHPQSKEVTLPVAVAYKDQQVWVRSRQAHYNFSHESGQFLDIDYGLTGSSANGSAESIEFIGGHTSQLHQILYTTCPGEQPDWVLSARTLKLQHEKGIGVARGAKLTFKGVPIFYAPWFTFPIDDRRKSGFLYPSFGNTSDNGFEFDIPWYWNIAPNHDATIKPAYISNRGFMLTGEYRLLTRKTRAFLDFDYMPDDKKTTDQRYHYRFQHHAAPWKRWRTALVLERVSDDHYFLDFSASLFQTSRQFLRSSALMNGAGRYWNFELMADDFQIIDETIRPENEPYRRVPRVVFRLDRPLFRSGFSIGLDSKLVYFDRNIGTTGARFDLYPKVYWDHFASWGFIKPSLGYRYTTYDLNQVGSAPHNSPNRGTAIASIDAGLYFDRLSRQGNYQTLEPRLFYLYVPYENQDDLPNFDTGEFTFGFSQLFNTNRFAGADRQGDANQLSVALSTRTFNGENGQELWRLSFGQIFYFETLRVQLENQPEVDENLSPFITELAWQPVNRLHTVAGLQYNWDERRLDVGSLGLRWSGKNGERIGFEYRFRRNRVDQFDFRIFWPINERWKVLSRMNYSLADNDILELQGGFEYESCCWAVRTVLRRSLKNRDGDHRDGIFFELSLKGLASLGTRSQDLFQN
ncbi:MAG: LPS assembly protein LptD [Xanthomonadales bacterium]